MKKYVANHFAFPNFTTPTPGTLREILDNDIAPRDKISLNGLRMKFFKAGGLSMMLKTVMKVAQYYTVFKYGPPKPQKDLKPQVRKIVAQPGTNMAPIFSPRAQQREICEGPPPQKR